MPLNRSIRLIPMLLFLSGYPATGIQAECRPEFAPGGIDAIQNVPEFALEREMLIVINQFRTQQGVQELALDENLTNIAREHSVGMARQGFISHQLPGDLQTRMSQGGYLYKIARENVASAQTIMNAQNALLHSSPHVTNMLATDVDRVGIGIVRCSAPSEKELFITEIFAGKREPAGRSFSEGWQYQSAGIKDLLLSRINDLCQNGAASLTPDPELERLASDSARTLNLPVKREELRNLLANSASELGRNGRTEITRLDVAVQLLHDPRDLEVPDKTLIGPKVGRFGAAVRPVIDNRNQTAFLVLTLIGYTK